GGWGRVRPNALTRGRGRLPAHEAGIATGDRPTATPRASEGTEPLPQTRLDHGELAVAATDCGCEPFAGECPDHVQHHEAHVLLHREEALVDEAHAAASIGCRDEWPDGLRCTSPADLVSRRATLARRSAGVHGGRSGSRLHAPLRERPSRVLAPVARWSDGAGGRARAQR